MSDNEYIEDVDCPECGNELEQAMVGEHATFAGGTAQVQTEWMAFCDTEGCARRSMCRACGRPLKVAEVGISSATGKQVQNSVTCSNPDCPTNDSELAPLGEGSSP